ncbi:MAG: efflux RND transporter periplasmic adaptor subunit [Planctomycetaceae bacterium]|nr:efflux RND transporter periplasmic adaptor subunit [Planctomycetaceae bacterium]
MRTCSLIGLVGLSLATAGCAAQLGTPEHATDEDAKSPASQVVAVHTVQAEEVRTQRSTTQPAAVHAYHVAEIRAKVTGYVDALNVDIGDAVDVNAVLAKISLPELESQQAVLQAKVERSRAEEAQAQAGVTLAQANVLSAEAQQQHAQAEAEKSTALLAAVDVEFGRIEELVRRQSIEPRALDEVRKRRDAELANRKAAESMINSAKADVTVAQAKLTAAQADLSAAQAATIISQRELEQLMVELEYTSLSAPFVGVVTSRTVDPGDLVRAGDSGDPLFVVSQLNQLRIRVHVPEADAAFVRKGDNLTLTLPSFPNEQFETTVSRVSSNLDPATRTMLVEAVLENTDGKLLPGMFGQATISLGASSVATVLPSRAVRFDASGQAFVYVLDDADAVTRVGVQTGRDTGETIEVVTGLTAGQMVIDHHLKRFQDGQTVRRLN